MPALPLLNWTDLANDHWPTLLLGNGVSINIWDKFKYDRLYDIASLDANTRILFENLGTTNFEEVLVAVYHTKIVDEALGRSVDQADQLYEEIRNALFGAVREVHIPWAKAGVSVLESFALALCRFDRVYTTNYDLLPYWAIMATDKTEHQFKDLLWGPGHTFDPTDAEVYGVATTIYYLHGGLHLWGDQDDGSCGKWRADGSTLLESDRFAAYPSRIPLFVSEGMPKEKLRTISRWQYLGHAADNLISECGNVVVFGSELGKSDEHIIRMIELGPQRQIAVGMLAGSAEMATRQARIQDKLSRHDVRFFDPSTHPLGSCDLHCG